MRIVFMGTPDFAVASLEALLQRQFEVAAVVTAPDKPSGRGQQLHQSAVKKYALQQNLPVLQPVNLKDPVFQETLRSFQADVQFVVAFRMLPEAVWNMPPLGTWNLHASLLPKYRGAAPINWAIINGDRESGVTTFKLQHEIDTGTILLQEKVNITEEMTAGELHDRLMTTGARLLVKTAEALDSVGSGAPLSLLAQDDSGVSHAPKIFKDDCRIHWDQPCHQIANRIRGLSPHPGAFTLIRNGDAPERTVRLYRAVPEIMHHEFTNGFITDASGSDLYVYCSDGRLRITDLQLEGKKRMPVTDFLRGYQIKPGAMFV